jgi:regulator of replication initiation timing
MSDTNEAFREIQGLVNDFQSLRDEKERLRKNIEILLGENAVLRERNRALTVRVDDIKVVAEEMGKTAMDYLAKRATASDITGYADRLYHVLDDPNSIEKYIKDNVIKHP